MPRRKSRTFYRLSIPGLQLRASGFRARADWATIRTHPPAEATPNPASGPTNRILGSECSLGARFTALRLVSIFASERFSTAAMDDMGMVWPLFKWTCLSDCVERADARKSRVCQSPVVHCGGGCQHLHVHQRRIAFDQLVQVRKASSRELITDCGMHPALVQIQLGCGSGDSIPPSPSCLLRFVR